MKADHLQIRLLVTILVMVSILSFAFFGAIQKSEAEQAMLNTLGASGPNSSLGDQAQVFDRFVGTWDCDFTFFTNDGRTSHSSGEVLFGWVLDGRAVQDIWISYPQDGKTERQIGTSLRFLDKKSRMWRVIFVNPEVGAVMSVKGGMEGDRIVLRGADDDGSEMRWSFNDIKADSFVWRGEKSRDGGKTWVLEEEHHMKRRTTK
jgi:hypothetical protein